LLDFRPVSIQDRGSSPSYSRYERASNPVIPVAVKFFCRPSTALRSRGSTSEEGGPPQPASWPAQPSSDHAMQAYQQGHGTSDNWDRKHHRKTANRI
jgi:hypothetical protein